MCNIDEAKMRFKLMFEELEVGEVRTQCAICKEEKFCLLMEIKLYLLGKQIAYEAKPICSNCYGKIKQTFNGLMSRKIKLSLLERPNKPRYYLIEITEKEEWL